MLELKQNSLEHVFKAYSRIVLFGGGSITHMMFEAYKDLAFEEKIDYIIDNDQSKDGMRMNINGKEVQLISIESFARLNYRNYALIVMPVFLLDIVKQIDMLPVFNGVPTYIYAFLMNQSKGSCIPVRHTDEIKIPKIIHYCWFGGKPLPDSYKENIESWKRYCPDYEIVEWNETNYDVKKNIFMRQAYERKQWAFVSDYARKDIIYNYGGIYFDTDVEVLRPIDDLLYNECFMCMDDIANINTGSGFGAVKGNELVRALRDDYDDRQFVNGRGEIVGKACGNYETPVAVRYGYRPQNKYQVLRGGGVVLPREVLCPISWIGMPDVYTENTLTVHKYDDLLIDNRGKEYASIQRQEIEELLMRARKDDDTSKQTITQMEDLQHAIAFEDKKVLVG